MDVENYREFCLTLPGVNEGFPFGEDVLVFKVHTKMFALISLSKPWFSVNLKCDPERSMELRDQYDNIRGAFHMNKKHWNTISFEHRTIPKELLIELSLHSYNLVVKSLPKKIRETLK